jgi:hypothetical protein
MWIQKWQLDPRTRRILVIGNLSLSIGLLLWIFVHPSGQTQKDVLDAVCGFSLGLSLGINLFAFWQARRCHEKQV